MEAEDESGGARTVDVDAHLASPRAAPQQRLFSLDDGCLVEVLSLLTDASLRRACCVCKTWRDAASTKGLWRAIFAGMYGEHSARWAHVHEPVTSSVQGDRAWRLRCDLRRRAGEQRGRGLVLQRVLPYKLGESPTTSSFFPSCIAIDGPWLAMGEFGGQTSLWDMRIGKRRWQKPHVLPGVQPWSQLHESQLHESEDDGPRVVTAVTVCAVGDVVVSIASLSQSVVVRTLSTGALVHRFHHLTPVQIQSPDGQLRDAPNFEMTGVCVYAPSRLGPEASGLGGLRVMTVDEHPRQPTRPPYVPAAFISSLWLLPTEGAPPAATSETTELTTACAPPRLLRRRDGAMSEQAGVIAEFYQSGHDVTFGPWYDRWSEGHEILLVELLTLVPLGRARLARARSFADGGYAAFEPTWMSVQRRTAHSWTLVMQFPQPRDRACSHAGACDSVIEAWLLRTSRSAEEVRTTAAAGPPAEQSEQPEDTLKHAPALVEATLLTVTHCPGEAVMGTPSMVPEWLTHARHRTNWVFCRVKRVEVEGDGSTYTFAWPGILNLKTGKRVTATSQTTAAGGNHVDDMCVDMRTVWPADTSAKVGAHGPHPWLLTEVVGSPPPGYVHDSWEVSLECSERRVVKGVACITPPRRLLGLPANAELRKLEGGAEPRVLWFRPPRGNVGEPRPPMESAASWRWLVLLDASGVHILDFLPPKKGRRGGGWAV